MRHTDEIKQPSPEQPARPGSRAEDTQQESPARLPMKVGPPEMSWSLAKWLALADQALLE